MALPLAPVLAQFSLTCFPSCHTHTCQPGLKRDWEFWEVTKRSLCLEVVTPEVLTASSSPDHCYLGSGLSTYKGPCGFLHCCSPLGSVDASAGFVRHDDSEFQSPGTRFQSLCGIKKLRRAQRSPHPPSGPPGQAGSQRPLVTAFSVFPHFDKRPGISPSVFIGRAICVCLTKLHLNNIWHKPKKCDPPHFSPACSLEPAGLLPKGHKILQLSLAA